MKEYTNNRMKLEEIKAAKIFLSLFYFIFFAYDISYYFVTAKTKGIKEVIPDGGMGYWYYLLVLGLLPIGLYILKKGDPFKVKYFIFFGFTLIDLMNDIWIYWGTHQDFRRGNIVEMFFVFFSPFFINKKFYWTTSIAIIVKYALIGFILNQPIVLIPVFMIVLLAALAYFLLLRFTSYVEAIKSIYEELRQKEKLAVLGQMATAIGHEIRNPLSSLKGFTQLQQEKHIEDNEYYSIMIQEIDRINSIVSDLMVLGKPKSASYQSVNLMDVMEYTFSVTQKLAADNKIKILPNFEKSLPLIECDINQLKQVVINLLKNAIEAMPDGGEIEVSLKELPDKKVVIGISDQGCGISEENLQRIGDPFFTTKDFGTGLGLMVSKHIIKEHTGQLNIKSTLKKGSQFDIVLPIKQS